MALIASVVATGAVAGTPVTGVVVVRVGINGALAGIRSCIDNVVAVQATTAIRKNADTANRKTENIVCRARQENKIVNSRREEKLECALYVVATPIGNLGDITLRAIDTLRNADVIAAEDTRVTKNLLGHLGIATKLIAVHEHNERNAASGIVNLLQQGKCVALVTDAGTPAISDPGAKVIAAVHAAGFRVVPIPGASALIAALSASGEGEYGFSFHGFLPATAGERRRVLDALRSHSQALVFYESPHRIVESVAAMHAAFGDTRTLVIGRELTKKFETVHRVALADAVAWLQADDNHQRGEFVLILSNPSTGAASEAEVAKEQALARTLSALCSELPLKQAVALAVKISGEKKNKVYQMALLMKGSSAAP